jgi:RNA polymerase sigma-70 factor (ECF subfamily)
VSLYRGFVTELASSCKASFTDEARIDHLLAAGLAQGREAWPAVEVEPSHFAAEVARRLGEDATLERFEAMRAGDVYLAIACSDGDTTAIAACAAILEGEVEHAARRTSATAAQAAEVAGALRRIVFVDEPPRPAAIRDYSGRGDLRSYFRVIAIRDLIRAVAKQRREVPGATDDLLARIVPQHDPELSFLREQYRDIVDDAMRAAVGSVDERSRALLRYQLVDGWSLDQIGKAYGVHRATVSRWMTSIRQDLGERIRAELASRLHVAVEDVESIVRLVRSRVDISLDRVLGPVER